MRSLAKIFTAALMLGSGAIVTASPADAHVGVTIGIGGPGYYGDYDYNRPCWFYRNNDLPAPARCYRYFYGLWGSRMYVDGDFIFRDRDDWGRWRDRDDYRHWHNHDFHWRGHDDHGSRGHDGGRDWGHDRGGHDRGHDGGHGEGGHGGGHGSEGHHR